jgi:hypothetical protein
MTNAAVEAGLLTLSLLIGLFGRPAGFIWFSAVAATLWWLRVHTVRLAELTSSAPMKAAGSFALAIFAIAIMHGVAFGIGYAFHAITGLK